MLASGPSNLERPGKFLDFIFQMCGNWELCNSYAFCTVGAPTAVKNDWHTVLILV